MSWKRIIRRTLLWIGIPWFVLFAWFYLNPPNYGACERYTAEMNGGVHVFQGKPYNIVLCGLDGRLDPAYPNDEVRLQVFSMEGELLAERYFEPLIGMRHLLKLELANDHLIYHDGEQRDFEKKMIMPPSKWEWIRARLPRPWPF